MGVALTTGVLDAGAGGVVLAPPDPLDAPLAPGWIPLWRAWATSAVGPLDDG